MSSAAAELSSAAVAGSTRDVIGAVEIASTEYTTGSETMLADYVRGAEVTSMESDEEGRMTDWWIGSNVTVVTGRDCCYSS